VAPEPPKQEILQMAEKAPAITANAVAKVMDKPTESPTVSRALEVLNRGSGKPGESTDLKDLVSNVDAVDGGSAMGGFDIAGAIAGLPGNDINIARSGGGGAISTMTGDEVADGVADLGDGTRSGEVRGKVTKMTSGLVVEGSLDKAEVSRVVNAHIHEIQACYERELLNNAEISGRIVFDWTITETGSVSNVRVRSSTLGSPAVADCISSLIKKWTFTAPQGGQVTITYPFLFRAVSS
jgi:TonB family protein